MKRYRTTSKRNEQLAWIVFALALVATVPGVCKLFVVFSTDDYSKYPFVVNVLSTIARIVSDAFLVWVFYMLFDIIIYSRALCTIDDSGITVDYRLRLRSNRFFAWKDIGKVLLATTASDRPELEFRLFTKDFATNGWGLARKLPPESKYWGESFFSIGQQKRMVTMQYTPELYELIKQHHHDIICIPNEQTIEGYREYLSEGKK